MHKAKLVIAVIILHLTVLLLWLMAVLAEAKGKQALLLVGVDQELAQPVALVALAVAVRLIVMALAVAVLVAIQVVVVPAWIEVAQAAQMAVGAEEPAGKHLRLAVEVV
jgi:hypothetical protein